ncbi:helix-turn-helix domain-containing protein [Streptomyces sp. NBC_01136]|uniref:helix-turn-helix domain-containing protein n=1 Tax=unclassified Streptomyces TaxID=2593676 RepID=UPI0032511D34|nr:helix-turn-helix domain-containing protein [Streptomyces sp. NBC_01136]
MPTLSSLCEEPDFCLRFVNGGPTADRTVDSVRALSLAATAGGTLGDVRDALVVIGDFWVSGRTSLHEGVEPLLRELSRQRAAGLAVVVREHGAQAVPVVIRSSAVRLGIPLLTTTKTLRDWRELIPRLREYRYRQAEWHADQLTALLNRLPDRFTDAGADTDAMQPIADWLAAAVDAEVVVSDPLRGVLAAAPDALARRAPRTASPQAESLPLSAAAFAAVLSVTSRRPLDDVRTDLLGHAAKVLGLIDQARLRDQLTEARREVQLSVLQLLMVGEEVAAQRVMAGLAPGLLATESVRVHVIDCARHDREVALRQAEDAVAGRALLARCPVFNHLIVVDPLPTDEDAPRSVRHALGKVVATLPGHHMGGSRVYALSRVADAYTQAAGTLVTARRMPGRVALAEQRPDLVDVLPPATARRWAGTLLRPVLTLPAGAREQLVRTLELGLEFQHTAVGRLLGIHRNTVTHRIDKGFDLLGLDRGQVLNRVVVSTALQVVVKYGHDARSADPAADFAAMVSAPEVRAWADSFLEPLRTDRRDLLRTLRVWLENDTHTGRTAAALDLAPVTVRSHLRAAAPLIQRDLLVGPDETDVLDGNEHGQTLSGVRPLAFALHAGTGRPSLPAA